MAHRNSGHRMKRPTLPYALLAFIFAVTAAYQARSVNESLNVLLHGATLASDSFFPARTLIRGLCGLTNSPPL